MKAKELGYKGEETAAHYLKSKGYEILQNNFTVRGGEIDLIARKNNILIFVEVKTRSNGAFGTGSESVSGFKRMRLRRTAARWLAINRMNDDTDYRLDVIEIMPGAESAGAPNINHIEDIE